MQITIQRYRQDRLFNLLFLNMMFCVFFQGEIFPEVHIPIPSIPHTMNHGDFPTPAYQVGVPHISVPSCATDSIILPMNFIPFYLTSHFSHSSTLSCSLLIFPLYFFLYCSVQYILTALWSFERHTIQSVNESEKKGETRGEKTGTDEQAFTSIIHC